MRENERWKTFFVSFDNDGPAPSSSDVPRGLAISPGVSERSQPSQAPCLEPLADAGLSPAKPVEIASTPEDSARDPVLLENTQGASEMPPFGTTGPDCQGSGSIERDVYLGTDATSLQRPHALGGDRRSAHTAMAAVGADHFGQANLLMNASLDSDDGSESAAQGLGNGGKQAEDGCGMRGGSSRESGKSPVPPASPAFRLTL